MTAAVVELALDGDRVGHRGAAAAAGVRHLSNEAFLRAVAGSDLEFRYRSAGSLLAAPSSPTADESDQEAGEPTWSLLVRAAHLAFAAHLPLSLSPDVIWYAIVHEVAVHVRLNSDHYASLFTQTPGSRQLIEIRDDDLLAPDPDWARSVRLAAGPLRDRIGAELIDLLQPAFSTTSVEDWTASLIAVMDVASAYYEFKWITLCGIPKIRLEGTAHDWQDLAGRAQQLRDRFGLLGPWFADLMPVLQAVADTAAGGGLDEEFWRSFYKWHEQSGGDGVTGWITALFAHRRTPDGLRPRAAFDWQDKHRSEEAFRDVFADNHFPAHLSVAPFRWRTPLREDEMVFLAGVMGIDRDGEFIRPTLGSAVARRLA